MARVRQIPKPPPAAEKPPAESVKETIDSIVIALVLALVFRAFIVEAFVIPTGSMADTLLGEHRHIVCPNCGYSFPVGLDSRDGQDTDVGLKAHALFCQNCDWHFTEDVQLLRKHNPDRGGDKILVFKFPYLFDRDPDRWDVVVFYNPANPDENFIKRLIGRPGETIQIIDGDIYAGSDSQDPTERAAFDNQMKIQRKGPLVQKALWRPVYLNDYLPKNRDPRHPGVTPMWLPAADSPGWASIDRILQFRPTDDTQRRQRVEFVPAVIPLPARLKIGFMDYVAYNGLPKPFELLNVVWDLRLEFVVFFEQPGGQVAASMNHRSTDDPEKTTRFNAVFHQDGRIELTENGQVIKAGKVDPFPVGRGVPVAFQNVDYGISVTVNNRQAIDYERQPDLATLRMLGGRGVTEQTEVPRVWIEASGGPLELRHVNLLRDVYYTSRVETRQGPIDVLRGTPDAGETIIRLKKHPADLRSHDEFFVLGDNSPSSSDSRLWLLHERGTYWHLREQIAKGLYRAGRVPRNHLIGKAFFVYWPAALPAFGSPVKLVPNVGDMRLIH